ncbi:MAG: hypothetical protein KC656_25325 [Myxococcales bacterium]|nr:hypothetical protein [Myxococcales bacterium]
MSDTSSIEPLRFIDRPEGFLVAFGGVSGSRQLESSRTFVLAVTVSIATLLAVLLTFTLILIPLAFFLILVPMFALAMPSRAWRRVEVRASGVEVGTITTRGSSLTTQDVVQARPRVRRFLPYSEIVSVLSTDYGLSFGRSPG